ncbi:MAG: WXG100 family type VII secretion target [Lachnospiraceae bacterium]|nr:WXG100 family type VII secretion target [Lachnospiraceae bacterium]
MTIDIDLDVLDSVSKKTGSLANQVRASASRVNNVSNDVETAWRSRSTASYTYEIDDTSRRLRKVGDDLENLSRAISSYSSNMRRIEREIASKVGGGR